MAENVNLSFWIPGSSVSTMQDEIRDGKVAATLEALRNSPIVEVDTDGDIPVREYTEDFDNAVDEALDYAGTTEGRDVLVIVTDLKCNDPERAERLLAEVKDSDDTVVIVPLSNDGYDEAWAEKLDADDQGPNGVDVVTVENLSNRAVVLAEVGPRVGISV